MYFNKVEICGIDTSSLKVLTEKEKCTLIDKAKGGDKHARETLVMGNLRLVLSQKSGDGSVIGVYPKTNRP